VARRLTDDAAVLGDLVLTHDMMVAGVHWPLGADPADVAWKLVGVNLSDLAAKGARPMGVLLGYMLGDDAWDAAFAAALGEALSHYSTALWGGDTVGAPLADTRRAIGLTAIGRASHAPVPSRAGVQAGDALWVTGTIGDAMLGFLGHGQLGGDDGVAAMRFRRPAPRIEEGVALAPLVTAMMDVSDGLLIDAQRMAQASGVTIDIAAGAVPLSEALRIAIATDAGLGERALRWGDDYELLFALPDGVGPPIAATRIGYARPQSDDDVLVDGKTIDASRPLGYLHHGE
jgi:thiamine-monophosphate kinase